MSSEYTIQFSIEKYELCVKQHKKKVINFSCAKHMANHLNNRMFVCFVLFLRIINVGRIQKRENLTTYISCWFLFTFVHSYRKQTGQIRIGFERVNNPIHLFGGNLIYFASFVRGSHSMHPIFVLFCFQFY